MRWWPRIYAGDDRRPRYRPAISLLAGLMLLFSGAPSTVYVLPDMHRLLLSVYIREGGKAGADGSII